MLARLVALGLVAATLPACSADPARGYSLTPAHAARFRTVAVPVFANSTHHTGLETDLTDAVIKEIQRQTPWRVSQSDAADAVLQGRITRVRLVRLSTASGIGLVQEQGVEVLVSFQLVDNRSGETVVARQGFVGLASYVPAQPTGERISVGYRGAAEALADDIVTELAAEW
jgi:hypothetical protein